MSITSSSSPLDVELGLKVRTITGRDASGGSGGRDGGGVEEVLAAEPPEPLSPGARVLHSPLMDSFIICMLGCNTRVDADVIKEGLKNTLIKHPRFSSKVVMNTNNGKKEAWIRTKVNVEDHIIVPTLDPNMDNSDQFVEDYVSDMTKTSLDPTKPLWELHILNIKTSNAESLGVFKIHHSLGDGMSLISLLLACTRKSSNPEELPSIPTAKSTSSSDKGGPYRCLIFVWLILRLIWNTLIHFGLFVATALFLTDTDTPIKGGKGVERSPKRIVHRIVCLDDIKLVKNEMNVTVNDVIVGITEAALSRYLHRLYEEGSIDTKRKNSMKKIRFRASVIVNIRQSIGIQDLAAMMSEGSKCKWGNKIGYILVPFHLTLEKDPLQYIQRVKAMIDQKKLSLEAMLSYYVALFALKVLGIKVAVGLAYRVLSNATLMISNLVGPSEELAFYGHPGAYVAPTVSGLPTGLLIHFQSYMNKMSIIVCASQDLYPDPHKLCDDFEESLRLMKEAIIQAKLKKESDNVV
ncbi:hypothetical protein Droror1_Dr00013139 [Drosera rotundifolia]